LQLTEYLLVAKIDAVQAEYSAFETLHETDGLIATAKELNVAYVAYSPLGHGWLVDNFDYQSPDDFKPDDFRRNSTSSTSPVPLLFWPETIVIGENEKKESEGRENS
jgi:aryl-alcohol dehydrogenase-like predicted oxidoreductase